VKNQIYTMRHGESRANTAGIIISHPENGIRSDWGLTPRGEEQVRAAAQKFQPGKPLYIFHSDFSRTAQSALIFAAETPCRKILPSILLRERFFGLLEGKSNHRYQDIWELDNAESALEPFGAEPAESVFNRMSRFVEVVNNRFSGAAILIISHGDPLQILLTRTHNLEPQQHRQVPHLNTAEIRELLL
jgi:broad specificity phosphatase PhoE